MNLGLKKIKLILSLIFCFVLLIYRCTPVILEDPSIEGDLNIEYRFDVKTVTTFSKPNFGPYYYSFITNDFCRVINLKTCMKIDSNFNPSGKITIDTSWIEFDKHSNITSKKDINSYFSYLYDSLNREIETNWELWGSIYATKTFYYTDSIVRIIDNKDRYVDYLDERGFMVSHQEYYGGRATIHEEFGYDSDNHLSKYKLSVSGDTAIYKENYTYNSLGALVSCTTSNTITDYIGHLYDSKADLIANINSLSIQRYDYDTVSNIITHTWTYDNDDFIIRKFHYDNYGNQIKVEERNNKTEFKTNEESVLIYDKYGNVLSKTSYYNGRKVRIVNFEYTYYD